jgi:molecular chaperone HtpG
MTRHHLEIHSENILPIIKKWLYSDKDIFVRELVSNACDAIRKVKILGDQGLLSYAEDELRVDIRIDKEAQTLTFTDTGVGMTADEVKTYIAQIAFSGAEDFVSKYKTNDEKNQFIGHFGLGFYSAYMVASKVEINTLSYQEGAEPVLWSCDGSSEYTIEPGTRTKRGTEIILHIDKESDEFLVESRLNHVLNHYCSFLPYPVYLDGKHINHKEPLWIKPQSACTTNDYLEFYRHLYPMEEDPLFWVHLNVDYPFHLKGILYFPKIQGRFDMDKSTIKLFCNRVFVSSDCKDIIPKYLTVLRGVIDSPDIPLNVSRSYLQMDRTVRQLSNHVSKKVSDSLCTLYKTDRDRYIQCWDDVSPVVKLGALEDDKFYDRVKEIIIWQNTAGEWTTIEEYLERNREKTKNKILYTSDKTHAGHILELYQQKGIEVLCTQGVIDAYLMQFLEKKISTATFQRIDAAIDEAIVDAEREKTILDAEGKTEAAKLADFVRGHLDETGVHVEAKSLASDAVPGFIMIDENQRRFRDYMKRVSMEEGKSEAFQDMAQKTFVVNTNNPLLHALQKLDKVNSNLAKEMIHEVFELSLLSQREIDPSQLQQFVLRSNRLLEHLALELAKRN